jgi:hypothetical protein
MKQYVTVTIDGVHIKAAKGTSVLDAAIEFGICIPHLCHVPPFRYWSMPPMHRRTRSQWPIKDYDLLYAECGGRHGDFE